MDIGIPLYLLFLVALSKLLFEVVCEVRRARDSQHYLEQMQLVQEHQAEATSMIQEHHADWRAAVEHETGKKFSEMSDAEVLSFVRSTDNDEQKEEA